MSDIERGTLQELSVHYAKKQPHDVEYLTEESPILASIKWEKATHGLWNVAEKVTDIKGAGFVKMNSALPAAAVASELVKQDLAIMGAEMFCPEDSAQMMGGKEKFFAKQMPRILKDAGNATEHKLIYDNFRAYAIDCEHAVSAGATSSDVSKGIYSMVAVRFIPGENCGLYSPEGFASGAMLNATPINGGSLYKNSDGILGYGVRLKGYFGMQLLNPKGISCILNISEDKLPTKKQIDKMLIEARANKNNTKIFMHPQVLAWLGETYKMDIMRVSTNDKGINTQINYWNEIEMISSYNFLPGTETIKNLD